MLAPLLTTLFPPGSLPDTRDIYPTDTTENAQGWYGLTVIQECSLAHAWSAFCQCWYGVAMLAVFGSELWERVPRKGP